MSDRLESCQPVSQPEESKNPKNLYQPGTLRFWATPAVRQGLVVLSLVTLLFCCGMGVGTSTVMLPQLKSKGEIYVDDAMGSWIYSSQGFGSILSALLIPFTNQWKGYKVNFLVICIPIIISFLLQYFATTVTHLLTAGIIQGLTLGGIFTLSLLGVSEYSEPRLRSFFLIIKSATYFWGIWIANVIGTFSYWRYIPVFAIWPALFALVSCYVWPEGPYWLASKGRIKECEESFQWLRGTGKDIEELASVISNQAPKYNTSNSGNIWTRMRQTVVLRQFYMPLILNCVLFCMYFFTGKMICAVYSLVIIQDITNDESLAYAGMLIIDAFSVVGMYVGSIVAIKVKRRTMFLSTSAVTILFLYLLSVYLTFIRYEIFAQNVFISLLLLVSYSFSVSWGPMVLCTAFLSEITPMRYKGVVVSIASVIFFVFQSSVLKSFPLLFESIGMNSSFGVFGTVSLITWLFLYKYLPETKNKTLQELELCFVNLDKDSIVKFRDK